MPLIRPKMPQLPASRCQIWDMPNPLTAFQNVGGAGSFVDALEAVSHAGALGPWLLTHRSMSFIPQLNEFHVELLAVQLLDKLGDWQRILWLISEEQALRKVFHCILDVCSITCCPIKHEANAGSLGQWAPGSETASNSFQNKAFRAAVIATLRRTVFRRVARLTLTAKSHGGRTPTHLIVCPAEKLRAAAN